MRLPVKQLTRLALYTALAMVISYLESFIPISTFIPLPGFKLGLANIVTFYVLIKMDLKSAVMLTLARTGLSALLFSGVSGFLYSILGGLFAVTIMALLLKLNKNSLCAISVAGAASHHTGQIIAASLMMKTIAVFGYLPLLFILSLPVGILTGFACVILIEKLPEKI